MTPLLRTFILLLLITIALSCAYQLEPQSPIDSRYTKLDTQGQAIAAWQGPWSCIVDSQTGLVWENKTDDESVHDALWTFSWYQQGLGVENAGDCYFEKDRCDTADLIRRVNEQQLCGYSSWRLPTSAELLSLVQQRPQTGKAKIANDFFSYTKRGDYWTADANIPLQGVYAHLHQGARSIDFIEGKVRDIPYRNAAFVRLVTAKESLN
ncbi:uncharacterized protein DUF1566 [Sinobacterium caligoides]|uniref:Uncharacterized protein DUF1566 n=1 Tax=Sinobacterium caligoides TaxID=933926 RepID=A0A3N2E1H4_9GAMM|nr:DUF1566 domain-containing protein [Sinobacterium caligoides]ROS05499.1 uncharacterized protein DUF1566 [Sinobacterium caligoides]